MLRTDNFFSFGYLPREDEFLIAYLENSLVRRTLFHFVAAVSMVATSMVSVSWGSVMRAFCFFVAVFFGASLKLDAAVINVDAAGRGWIETDNSNNGNSPSNNYFAGSSDVLYRNHFDFAIPSFTGALDSASFVLRNDFDPNSHTGATHTYSLYGLGAYGSYSFSDIESGTVYGSVTISSVGIVSVTLNASAIADISAAQGSTFSLGGVHSGELLGGENHDFGFSQFGDASATQLILNTSSAAVPEPTSLAIFGLGAGIAGLKARRRKRAV